jgi:hypothetical protein
VEPEGLVENMSQLVSEHCGARNAPFPASPPSFSGDDGELSDAIRYGWVRSVDTAQAPASHAPGAAGGFPAARR